MKKLSPAQDEVMQRIAFAYEGYISSDGTNRHPVYGQRRTLQALHRKGLIQGNIGTRQVHPRGAIWLTEAGFKWCDENRKGFKTWRENLPENDPLAEYRDKVTSANLYYNAEIKLFDGIYHLETYLIDDAHYDTVRLWVEGDDFELANTHIKGLQHKTYTRRKTEEPKPEVYTRFGTRVQILSAEYINPEDHTSRVWVKCQYLGINGYVEREFALDELRGKDLSKEIERVFHDASFNEYETETPKNRITAETTKVMVSGYSNKIYIYKGDLRLGALMRGDEHYVATVRELEANWEIVENKTISKIKFRVYGRKVEEPEQLPFLDEAIVEAYINYEHTEITLYNLHWCTETELQYDDANDKWEQVYKWFKRYWEFWQLNDGLLQFKRKRTY